MYTIYHHFVFLTSLEPTLGVHHACAGMNFKLALSSTALDAILDSSVFSDILIVCENLTQISRVISLLLCYGKSIYYGVNQMLV